MTQTEEQEHHRQREKHFFIPAGALIGLGAGLIAGHPVPGILIGLGLGFCAQALFKSVKSPEPDLKVSCCWHDNRLSSVVIGLFLIVIGVEIVWSPANLWPYIIGVFLILAGILIAAMSLRKVS